MRVDGGAAETGGAAIGVEDLEVEFALELDDEDVVLPAVGRVAPGHADEGVGRGGDEDFV